MRKNEMLPFAAGRDLEGIVLSEISQRKTNTVGSRAYESRPRHKRMYITKQNETHRRGKQTQRGDAGAGGGFRDTNYEVRNRYKKLQIRLRCRHGETSPSFCGNFKWSILY